MRQVKLRIMVTTDGVISDVESWMVRDEELDNDFNAELATFGTALVGYGSYNDMAHYWSKLPDNPSASKIAVEMAHLLNYMPKMILSRTEEELGWDNSGLVLLKDDSDFTEVVGELKKQSGKDIYLVGGRHRRSGVRAARLG